MLLHRASSAARAAYACDADATGAEKATVVALMDAACLERKSLGRARRVTASMRRCSAAHRRAAYEVPYPCGAGRCDRYGISSSHGSS
jgi:hypothetical protein